MPKFVLSPCGTSLLTNQVSDIERKLIGKYANTKHKHEVLAADLQQLEALIDRVEQKIIDAVDDYELVTRMSAELNSIIKLYDGRIVACQDHHVLLCTDTWLGETTANLVKLWLENRGLIVEPMRHPDLQTKDIEAFQMALSELVRWCESTLPGYRQAGYQIIFNLTGGFKSVQGFLQTLSTFYADETIYIFETAQDLLRIPRLPVEMNAEKTVRKHLNLFRQLEMGLPTPTAIDIPETLLMKIDDEVALSPWGSIIWEQTRKLIYKDKVYPSPSTKLVFGEKFEQSVRDIIPERTIAINERIDQLAKCLEIKDKYNPPMLNFKQIQSHLRPPSTHQIHAWEDGDAKRMFGHYEGNIFILDKLDRHL